ncbi:MAG: excisionase [Hydrogenophaga sp.]|nr:excisionase [Hydrogenophaga sp.]
MTDIIVQPSETVLIRLAAAMTGHTPKALERKIARGVLAEGIHYHRHDGNIYINMPAFQGLVRGEKAHVQDRRRG